MDTKQCTICQLVLAITCFNFRNKSKNKRHSACSDCCSKQVKKHYKNNKSYYYERNVVRRDSLREIAGEKILAYLLEHPCVDCGERNPLALQFDHLHSKKGDVSWMRLNQNWEKVEKEIEKCEVRCANCHCIKTAKSRNTWMFKRTKGIKFGR